MGLANNVWDKVIKPNTIDPFKRISSKANSVGFFDKPGTLVAETLKEGLIRLPAENILRISGWTTKQIFSLIGKTLKMGLMAASLIPIPLPGGAKSVAEMRGNVSAFRETLTLLAKGNPKSFREVYANIRGIRKDAETRATDGAKPAV